jgi:hypothetical protein
MSTVVPPALLDRLVDDAGLFPPARLPMAEAVQAHHAAKSGPAAFLVGRFLCPASRLAELRSTPGGADVEVGAILDTVTAQSDETAVTAAVDAALLHRVASFEVAATGPDLDRRVAVLAAGLTVAPAELPVFVELPVSELHEWPQALRVLAAARAGGRAVGAKIRCGGLEKSAFPSQGELAAFLAGCQAAGVPFKATAGLHHAVAHTDAETGFEHHGFLNLLLACTAVLGGDARRATTLLAERDAGVLVTAATALDGAVAGKVRSDLLVGFGSCSVAEPAADLWALGLVPEAA